MASKSAYYTHLINSTRWRRLRAAQLTHHPYCQRCETLYQLITPATCVHHVEPVEGAHSQSEQAALMFNPTNLQSLCYQCHKDIHQAEGYHKADRVKERKVLRVNEQLSALYGDIINENNK